MALRADLFSAPTAAVFEALEDDLAMVDGSGTVEWSGWTDCTIEIPRDIIVASGRLVGIYDGPDLIDEFIIETQRKSVSREGKNTWSLSGPQVNGLTQKIGIWPQDYPIKPSVIRDWIWDGEDVITNGDFEDTSAISEIYELDLDGATGGTFTLEVGGATTPAQNHDVSEAALETAIEALSGTPPVVDVDVDATGDGFNIEFADPATLDVNMIYAGSLTGGGGDDELTVTQEGDNLAPPNWTRSQFLDSGSDPAIHGTYASDGFRLTKGFEAVDTGSLALRVNGLTQYAGAQTVVNVIPGQTYQGRARVYTSDPTEVFKFIIRDARNHAPLVQDGGLIAAANTWTTYTIADWVVPAGVTQVIVRVASVTDKNPLPWQLDNVSLTEGFQAATPGKIIRLLLEAAQSRATGDWLDLNFSDTLDTLSVSWGTPIAFRAFPPQSLAHVLEGLHQLGVNWHITRKTTPVGALTHDLNAYAKDSAPDLTATVEILSPPKATSVDRLPQATSRIAFGDGGIWDELVDAAAVTSFGRWEGQFDAEHLLSEAAINDFLTDIQDEEQINRLALQTTMYQNSQYAPLVDFRPGDKVEWQIPAIQATVTRPVKTISWRQGETAEYEITGSKVFDSETGLARAVEFLLDEIKPRAKSVGGTGEGRAAAGTVLEGAFVHLSRNATQSIAVGGEAIAWDLNGLANAGFSVSLPVTAIVIPKEGYYNVAVQAGWLTWKDGGTLWITRTRGGSEIIVWPPADDPGLWTATDGKLFEATAPAIPLNKNDIIQVKIDADDGFAQTLDSATVAVYLIDRAEVTIEDYASIVLADDALGYWRLGETSGTNAVDATGAFDAVYQNTPTLGVTGIMQDGLGDLAADFVAASSEHVLGQDWAPMDFASGPFSIEAWFKVDALSGTTQIIIEKQVNLGVGWELGVVTAGVFFADDGGAVVSSGTLVVDTDYHVVVTSDQTTTLLYLNGVQVDSDVLGLTITANAEVVSIARDTGAPGFNFDGTIDEVAVYARVLTPTEVAEHFVVGTRGA